MYYDASMTKPTTTALGRLLDQVGRCLTPETAKALVQLRADPEVQDRIHELAAKSNEGQLSDEERAEYDAIIDVLDFIAILQAKARALLRQGYIEARPEEREQAWKQIQKIQRKASKSMEKHGVTEDDLVREILKDD